MFSRIFGSLILVGGAVWSLSSCSDSSTATSNVPSAVGSAVGSVFSSSGGDAVRNLPVENDTCGEFRNEEGAGGGPEGVEMSASIEAGTYGSTSDPVTVTVDDDCESEATNAFAAFELTADVAGTCTGDLSVTMKAGSAGISRNTSEYEPEIFGTFSFDVNGTTYEGIKCTIRLDGNGAVVTAVSSCVDSAGAAVTMSASNTCTFGE